MQAHHTWGLSDIYIQSSSFIKIILGMMRQGHVSENQEKKTGKRNRFIGDSDVCVISTII